MVPVGFPLTPLLIGKGEKGAYKALKGGERWFQEIQVGIVGNRAVYGSCFGYIVKLEEILMVFVL